MDVTKPYKFIGFVAMEVTKPYKFIGLGAMEVTKPYKFIGFGAMDVTKPYKFIRFGAMDVAKPYVIHSIQIQTFRAGRTNSGFSTNLKTPRSSRGVELGTPYGKGADTETP